MREYPRFCTLEAMPKDDFEGRQVLISTCWLYVPCANPIVLHLTHWLLCLYRSLKMPPEPIADVLGAVLMLLGIRDTSWLSMKKFLGNRGVKEDILNFDARRIDPQLRAKVLSAFLSLSEKDVTFVCFYERVK